MFYKNIFFSTEQIDIYICYLIDNAAMSTKYINCEEIQRGKQTFGYSFVFIDDSGIL